MTYDTKKPYRELGNQPKGRADYVVQDGVIYAWSESNIQYEKAWWVYHDWDHATSHMIVRMENILRDRPFPSDNPATLTLVHDSFSRRLGARTGVGADRDTTAAPTPQNAPARS